MRWCDVKQGDVVHCEYSGNTFHYLVLKARVDEFAAQVSMQMLDLVTGDLFTDLRVPNSEVADTLTVEKAP